MSKRTRSRFEIKFYQDEAKTKLIKSDTIDSIGTEEDAKKYIERTCAYPEDEIYTIRVYTETF